MDVADLAAALPAGYRAAETLPRAATSCRAASTPRCCRRSPSWCATQGALADDVQVARRSLEDVFLELTGRELRS